MTGELQVIERSPSNDVAFGKKAAKALMDVVREQGLARKFGGQKEHIYVEAWQLLGQFAGLSAEVRDAEAIEIDTVKGAKAHVVLVDNQGKQVGGAVAFCMRDEPNWKNKPWFQLASMAQTRAVSKAFRNRLSWIAVLAGYSGTPAEEMEDVHQPSKQNVPYDSPKPKQEPKTAPSLEERKTKAEAWLTKNGKGIKDAEAYLKTGYAAWTAEDLQDLIDWGKRGFPPEDDEDAP